MRAAVDIGAHHGLGCRRPGCRRHGDDKDRALATQTSNSNGRLVIIGALVLIVGVILVLLILRGSVGGDDPVVDQPVGTDGGDPEQVEQADDRPELVSGDETSTARVELPLELEDGFEAVTVRAGFARGLAALPAAGDRVVVYRLGDAEEDGEEGDDDGTPAPEGDAERVLEDVEVLGVIGPRPAANDGTLTFVLAVDEGDVPGLLPIARDAELWLTLLPGDDADDAEAAADAGDEDDAA